MFPFSSIFSKHLLQIKSIVYKFSWFSFIWRWDLPTFWQTVLAIWDVIDRKLSMFKLKKNITLKDTCHQSSSKTHPLILNTFTSSCCPFMKKFPKSSSLNVFSCTVVSAPMSCTDTKCLPVTAILTMGKSQKSML